MRIVVCAEMQWRYLRARKQQLLRRFPPDWRILFLQPTVRGRRNDWWPRRDGNVTYVTVPVLKNVPQPALRALLDRGWVRFPFDVLLWFWVTCLRLLHGCGGRRSMLYVSNIYYGRILRFLPRRAAVYDCNDNHLAFPDTPAWARGYFEALVRGVDAVVVSQPLLRQEIEPLAPAAVFDIGNGVDFALFDAAWRAPMLPAQVQSLPAPRLGYAGALAAWIDFALLERLAQAFPAASLVLVGPAFGELGPVRNLLAAHRNAHWLGPVPHAELPHFVAGMDVCLIPFRQSALTRGVNPNKLYEYFALGKPVVSTDFSPWLRKFEPMLRVAADADDWLRLVAECIESRGDAAARREVARQHGWDASAAAMVQLFERLAAGEGSA